MTELAHRILELGLASLARANMDAVFLDRGKEHRRLLIPISAAHAGELILKAIIAQEDPYLIFENPSACRNKNIDWLLQNAKTIKLSRLPTVLMECTGEALNDTKSFDELKNVRNAIQHFTYPSYDTGSLCLEFIYSNIDPLLWKHFGICAYQIHEDDFDDYIVDCLFQHELQFSNSGNIELYEIDPRDSLSRSSDEYREWANSILSPSA